MHRWKLSLLAAAATLSTGLYIADASALSLGRVTVQSALGEPLRAEIALPQITAAEADSLHVTAASPEVFRAQGLEYSPTVGGIQVQLLRRANGSAVVQLSSNSPINDPFLDLVIDATWNAGHIVRSYTMLFDPPGLQQRTPVTVNAAPQVQAAPRPVAPTPAPVSTPAPAPAPAPARAASTPARSAPVRDAAAPAVAAPAAAPVARPPAQVTVRKGDTAGAIASTHRPANVSLDQMLVAMLRANPQAFIEGNVNRVRAGAVLQMPGQSDAQATPAAEARRIIAAQSRDFNEFRRRLAGTAPTAPVEAAQRSASGKVQAQVAESKPEAASVDKLTLSKGSADVAAEAKTAQVQQADENAARKAELAKNISDLKQLSESASSSTPAMPEAPVPAAATTPPAQETPQTPAAAASAESSSTTATSADTPAAAEAPAAAPATAPVPTPAPTSAAAAPTSEEEPGLLESLTQDPWTAGGIVVLLLALLGWAGYRSARRRREQESPETMFANHREPGDSFFAASGGQRVDTTSNDLTTGSTLYTPSQLDTDGEIDPVAEASVYLAYGKDVEAERILNAAATRNPDHVGVQAKLAEVYAKRHDRPGLEAAARKVLDLTQGQGPDWEAVLELGRALDPDNALYQAVPPAEAPAAVSMTAPEPAPAPAEVPDMLADRDGASTGPDSLLPDIDLDLDLDPGTQQPAIDAEPTVSSPGAFATAVAAAAAQNSGLAPLEPAEPTEPATLADTLGNDVPTLPAAIWDTPPEHAPTAPEPPFAPPAEAASFSTSGLSLLDSGVAPLTSHDAKLPEPAPLDFDLGELSLDLNSASAMLAPAGNEAAVPPPAVQEPLPSDPLSTKLALAEEFKTIGDSEGARALVEEVLAEATGELRDRAQRLLATLG